MIILPAIDIIGGKPVRLIQGDYDQVSQVADSVFNTARKFEEDGLSLSIWWIWMEPKPVIPSIRNSY